MENKAIEPMNDGPVGPWLVAVCNLPVAGKNTAAPADFPQVPDSKGKCHFGPILGTTNRKM